jgi:hypothetical protein
VNWWPENLRWGWQSDNLTIDRTRDGTSVNGERIYGAKLTAAIVTDCRRRRLAGESVIALAAEFGVNRTSMHRAITGRNWGHLALASSLAGCAAG